MADLLRSGSGALAPARSSWATTSGVIVTRWGRVAPSRVPPRALTASLQSPAASLRVAGAGGPSRGGRGPTSDQVLGLGERVPQHLLHLLERTEEDTSELHSP